ncbi:MAG: glycosyltransferase family 2 protein [Anaerolineales bacterium]|nr:glycosyltransferase family 2 protein [Anaerolineales bacterium]
MILSDPFHAIGVIIPAFRAEKHILKVLAGIPRFVSFIIVVDDCSPDHTAELVETCLDSRIYLVSHGKNQGVGGAVITGYTKAVELGAKIIVKMDSDDQMDPAYLIHLIVPILMNQADYTKGNRFLHADELKSMPLIRRIGNAALSFLTKAASGYWNIFDPTNGYTAIHASIIPLLDTDRLHSRFFFESSMLMELGMIRAVVQDVHIPARYRNEVSSLSEWKALFEFPPRLLAGFLHRLLIQYFVRDFGVFSLLLILGLGFSAFGLLFGLYHWYYSSITRMIASTGTVMIAVLPLILGWQLLIQCITVDMQNIPQEPLHDGIDVLEKLYQKFGE